MNGAGTSAGLESGGNTLPYVETIACVVCRAANDPSEQRCNRCGRRLHLAAARSAPIEFQPSDNQRVLFREPIPGGAKIIPIPTLTPAVPKEREARAPRQRAQSAPRSPRKNVNQQVLEFGDAIPLSQAYLHDEVIGCDAPVAPPLHRLIAAAVDAGLVVGAVVVFLMAFYAVGGRFSVDREALMLIGAITAIISVFYRCVWCIAGGDTPGMQFAGLRLVDFDGRTPGRDRRIARQFAGTLSLVSAGLGLVWALLDEESLTWHDRISKTFPTAS